MLSIRCFCFFEGRRREKDLEFQASWLELPDAAREYWESLTSELYHLFGQGTAPSSKLCLHL